MSTKLVFKRFIIERPDVLLKGYFFRCEFHKSWGNIDSGFIERKFGISCIKSLKIVKGYSVVIRRTVNTMAKKKTKKRQIVVNNYLVKGHHLYSGTNNNSVINSSLEDHKIGTPALVLREEMILHILIVYI